MLAAMKLAVPQNARQRVSRRSLCCVAVLGEQHRFQSRRKLSQCCKAAPDSGFDLGKGLCQQLDGVSEPAAGHISFSRRAFITGSALLMSSSCIADDVIPGPQNDDQAHFTAPWMYEATRDDAINRLIEVATGGAYDPGYVDSAFGVPRTDAAKFILGTTANFFLGWILNGQCQILEPDEDQLCLPSAGKPLPERPKRQKLSTFAAFDGKLEDRHLASDGSEYVRITFGTSKDDASSDDIPGAVIDAEFSFPEGDSIVNVRAASRSNPALADGELKLSFSYGVEFDRNVAGQKLEALRRAVGWEVVPVMTDFDPKFNNDEPLWFEKFYQPFKLPSSS